MQPSNFPGRQVFNKAHVPSFPATGNQTVPTTLATTAVPSLRFVTTTTVQLITRKRVAGKGRVESAVQSRRLLLSACCSWFQRTMPLMSHLQTQLLPGRVLCRGVPKESFPDTLQWAVPVSACLHPKQCSTKYSFLYQFQGSHFRKGEGRHHLRAHICVPFCLCIPRTKRFCLSLKKKNPNWHGIFVIYLCLEKPMLFFCSITFAQKDVLEKEEKPVTHTHTHIQCNQVLWSYFETFRSLLLEVPQDVFLRKYFRRTR